MLYRQEEFMIKRGGGFVPVGKFWCVVFGDFSWRRGLGGVFVVFEALLR